MLPIKFPELWTPDAAETHLQKLEWWKSENLWMCHLHIIDSFACIYLFFWHWQLPLLEQNTSLNFLVFNVRVK